MATGPIVPVRAGFDSDDETVALLTGPELDSEDESSSVNK